MTSSERRPGTGTATATAGAMGAKTARACDSCLRRRARWYCAADDAFLCQSCDASVHSANPLASRHDRVRLKSASDGPCAGKPENDSLPPWLHGLRRKARTPRKPGFSQTKPSPTLLVPDLDHSNDDSEEQLLYRVPIFDPIMAEFCSPSSASDPSPILEESKPAFLGPSDATQLDHLPTFLASDTEFADFAADVESLLGRGMSEDAFCMEGLGLLETREDEMRMEMDCCFDTGRVKQEEDEKQYQVEDLSRETLELNFGYESPTTAEEEEEEKMAANFYGQEERKVLLRLDYKAVITAWGSQGSPWVVGDRPTFNLDDAWPDCIGTSAPAEYHPYGEMVAHATAGDGGREARVSRYREKRRTRLFSKKIRYEVRKLNAEKRPRMKGRFVKRASFAAPAFPF